MSFKICVYTTNTTLSRLKFYKQLAEGPGVARDKKLEKNHPPATHECPQQISVQSAQPFGRLKTTYIYIYKCLVFLYRLLINSAQKQKERQSYYQNSGNYFGHTTLQFWGHFN